MDLLLFSARWLIDTKLIGGFRTQRNGRIGPGSLCYAMKIYSGEEKYPSHCRGSNPDFLYKIFVSAANEHGEQG
jgi:hypothetical protein